VIGANVLSCLTLRENDDCAKFTPAVKQQTHSTFAANRSYEAKVI